MDKENSLLETYLFRPVKSYFPYLLYLALIGYFYSFSKYGFNIWDEGGFANGTLRTLNGQKALEDFSKAIGSFGVSSQARQATARAKAAKITGTPEMMVNGKYRISTRKAGSQANMLKIASYLIDKERSAAGS